jgi:serine/threonine protein kinase/tetratricopeptide (TPR) repeat protein
MKCPKCHSDNPDTKRFCGECGTQLIPAEEIPSPTKTLETPKEEFTRGTTLANRYEFIEELGKGGMGNVYKVFDKKIKEEIALKLLRSEIAADEKTIERFSNELKLARKIVHKNVGRMYELMEEEGTHFITMEYVPGEDLKSFIKRSGQLTAGKAVSIAKQVCDGMAEAQRLGVVHRDLKPQNIMIDKEGNARIMDFGIARALKAKGITAEGIIIGTPEYMSPEQVEGKEVDQRSDIYSLGIILYEMVTGKVPFEGDTPFSIAMKHKTEAPPDPRKVNAQVPEELSRMIIGCMEKDKAKRYQNVDEILSELSNVEKGIPITERIVPKRKPLTLKEITVAFGLRKPFIPALVVVAIAAIAILIWQLLPQKGPVSLVPSKPSVTVLPFTDLSPQKDQEYLCEGMADSIINSLTCIKDIRVPAITSAFSFKDKEQDLRFIGERLNVETVLQGSLQKADNRLRITARLINVDDESIIWSDQFNRELDDVFAIQDEITLAIVDNLKITLIGGEKARLVKRHTENLEAYNLCMKGVYSYRMYTPKGIKDAFNYLEQALQKDPDYAMAYFGLARTYATSALWGYVPPKIAYPKAKTYLKKALEIDNNLGEAHALLGYIHVYDYDWNWEAAERELKQGLQLNPSSADIHVFYSFFLTATRRHEEAIVEIKRAQELDPLSRVINRFVGFQLVWGSQYDRAIEELKTTLTMFPNDYLAHFYLGLAYQGKSMFEEAISEYEKAIDLSGGDPMAVVALATTYYELGKEAQAEKLFDSLIQMSRHQYVPPMAFFYYHLLLRGDQEQASEWLERAYNERDGFLIWGIVFPYEPLRIPDEPKFREILKRVGLK